MNSPTITLLPAFLMSNLLTDPRTALAAATAWLDPIPSDDPDDLYEFTEEAFNLITAAQICRRCLPAVYAQLTALLRQNQAYDDIEIALCHAVNTYLHPSAPLESIEQMRFGIPFTAWGFDWNEEERDHHDERIGQLLECFGDPDNEPFLGYHNLIARALANSLEAQNKPNFTHLAWLLRWLFGASGSTAVDYTLEEISEGGFDLPDWSPQNIEFFNELHTEAIEIIDDAHQAIELLAPDLLKQITKNIQSIKREIKRRNIQNAYDHDPTRLIRGCQWTHSTDDSPSGTTAPHP